MKFRLGKKQGLAILYAETGKEYLIFPKGEEQAAKEYCDYINNVNTVQELHDEHGYFQGDNWTVLKRLFCKLTTNKGQIF